MREAASILKDPALGASEDFTALRTRGIELIERLGSDRWTDYNIHDPGITLLELLCYAETEIGYKLGFSIQDLLATEQGGQFDQRLQCFFPAREILTCNPYTPLDFRKLLIDIIGVRNAWVTCRRCACGITLYANCKTGTLQYAKTEHPVVLEGFRDAALELDTDPVSGDLNSGKIFTTLTFPSGGRLTDATIEVRLPPWHRAASAFPDLDTLVSPDSAITSVAVTSIAASKNQVVDVLSSDLYRSLRRPMYAALTIGFKPDAVSPEQITTLLNVPVRIWYRSDDDRKAIDVAIIRAALADATAGGVVPRYLVQLKKAAATVAAATASLHAHRNLAEDYCVISTVPVEDVALCADIHMRADTDIEEVLGNAYREIDRAFNPPVRFHSLQEMLDRGIPTEEIFNGPPLEHGFLVDAAVRASELKTALHASDIINILMDIDGIEAVSNLTLARYDADGNLVESQPWELEITAGHQPRLYIHASKVLVYKNGLPFLPDPDELNDTLALYRAIDGQNKLTGTALDYLFPAGAYVDNETFLPLQETLPETYGAGRVGLPEPSTAARKGQAMQLKGYLLVLEYLLAVYISQLRHFRDLLSIDPAITQTYFPNTFTEDQVHGATALSDGIGDPLLLELLETPRSYAQRRNAFLDHLLARFAESFSEYALMLYTAMGSKERADEELIRDKISFLEAFSVMSRDRAKSFNIKPADASLVCSPDNISGLERRIKTLLGMNGLADFFSYTAAYDSTSSLWSGYWTLKDSAETVLLQGTTATGFDSKPELMKQLIDDAGAAVAALHTPGSIQLVPKPGKNQVVLVDSSAAVIGSHPSLIPKKPDAEALIKTIDAFVDAVKQAEKVFVVEHILLRPRSEPSLSIPEGDPLLPVCLPPSCEFCGEEDPYSHRITVLLNGEAGIANEGIGFRRFADRTIRLETPAHLGVKICWVSADQLKAFEDVFCPWLMELAKPAPDPAILHQRLADLLAVFTMLKSVYPKSTLHDCVDGDDDNRIFLNQTNL